MATPVYSLETVSARPLHALNTFLSWLTAKRIPIPVSRILPFLLPHLSESKRADVLAAIPNALGVPPVNGDPTISFFFFLHASVLTLWFKGTKEKADGKSGRTRFGAWFQGWLGFITMNMIGNILAGMLTARPPLMLLNSEMLPGYAVPYLLISILAEFGLDLPKIVMGNAQLRFIQQVAMNTLSGIAQTMVISGNADAALTIPGVQRSLPGQFALCFIASTAGAAAVDGLALQKLEWRFAMPQGLKEVWKDGFLYVVLGTGSVLYIAAVNQWVSPAVRLLANLPPSEKPAPVVEPALARLLLVLWIVPAVLANFAFMLTKANRAPARAEKAKAPERERASTPPTPAKAKK
ncbi:hypothetical protein DFJ74DRAFT_767514 [Hyaloraphidium curvatum]|nr:hypothetical protein DFJ74DRAFT_767514 [Hyaloraphidium curvatum]